MVGLVGWVCVKFIGAYFSFPLGEKAQDRYDYQKCMADCLSVNFFPSDKYLDRPRTVPGAIFNKVGKASGSLPY